MGEPIVVHQTEGGFVQNTNETSPVTGNEWQNGGGKNGQHQGRGMFPSLLRQLADVEIQLAELNRTPCEGRKKLRLDLERKRRHFHRKLAERGDVDSIIAKGYMLP